MSGNVIKIISIVVLGAFLSGQSVTRSYAAENLATSIVSNDSLDPYGNHSDVKADMARMAKPSAVGKGESLIALLKGKVPDRLVEVRLEDMSGDKRDKLRKKIIKSINYAVLRHIEAEDKKLIPLKYIRDGRFDETLKRLILLKSRLTSDLFLYSNSVINPDDYLLGFSDGVVKGFDLKLVETLPVYLLAQFIYHECVPEYTKSEIVNGKIDRVEHKQIYEELQNAVFSEPGKDRVKELGQRLNAFIIERTRLKLNSVITRLIKANGKITYAAIADSLDVRVNDLLRWRKKNKLIADVIHEARTENEYIKTRLTRAIERLTDENKLVTSKLLAYETGFSIAAINSWRKDPDIKTLIKESKSYYLRNKRKDDTIGPDAEKRIKDAIENIFEFPGTNKIWRQDVIKVSGVGKKYSTEIDTLIKEASVKRIEDTITRFKKEGRDLYHSKIAFDISDEAKVPYKKNHKMIYSALSKALEDKGRDEISAIGNGSLLTGVALKGNSKRLPPRVNPGQFDNDRREKIKKKVLFAAKQALEKHNNALDQLRFPAELIFDPEFKITEIEGNLNRLIRDLEKDKEWTYLYPFSDQIAGPENYLLGFRTSEYFGLDIELIESLPRKMLVQYVYHESIPENDLYLRGYDVLIREEHKRNYSIIQRAVFGAGEVKSLGEYLRKFISFKLVSSAVKRLILKNRTVSEETIAEMLELQSSVIRRWKKEHDQIAVLIDETKERLLKRKVINIIENQVEKNRSLTKGLIAGSSGMTITQLNRFFEKNKEIEVRFENACIRQKKIKEERRIRYLLGIPEKDIREKGVFYEDITVLNELLTDISGLSRGKRVVTLKDLVNVNKRGLSAEKIRGLIAFYPVVSGIIKADMRDVIVDRSFLTTVFTEANNALDEMLSRKENITQTAILKELYGIFPRKEVNRAFVENPLIKIKLTICKEIAKLRKEREEKDIFRTIQTREDFLRLLENTLDISERDFGVYSDRFLAGEDITNKSIGKKYGIGPSMPGKIIKNIEFRIQNVPLLREAKKKIIQLDKRSGAIAKGTLRDRLNKVCDMKELEGLLPRIRLNDPRVEDLPVSYTQALKRTAALLDGAKREKYIEEQLNDLAAEMEDALFSAGNLLRSKEKEIREEIFKYPFSVEKTEEARRLLDDLFISDLSEKIYLFNARSEGPDNYIAGFNKVIENRRYAGLSLEVIFFLIDSPELLGEYIFHEFMCGSLFEHNKLLDFQRKIFPGNNMLRPKIHNALRDAGFNRRDIEQSIDQWFGSSGAKKEIIGLMTEYGIPIDPEQIEDPRYIIVFMSSIAFDERLEGYFNEFFAFLFDYDNEVVEWGSLLSHIEEVIFDPEADLDLPLSIFLELWYHWNEKTEEWDDAGSTDEVSENYDISDRIEAADYNTSEEKITIQAATLKTYFEYIVANEPENTFIIAVDTDLGPEQSASIMQLWRLVDDIKEMKNTTGNNMFPNIKILRGSGSKGEISRAIRSQSEADKGDMIKPENIMIISSKKNIESDIFNEYRHKAWMAGIDDDNSGYTGYLPVFETATLTIMAAMDMDIEAIKEFYDQISGSPVSIGSIEKMIRNRELIVLPKIIKINTGKELLELYRSVRRIYTAA